MLWIQRSKIWLSVRPGQPKKSPDNQKYWCGCPADNHKFSCPRCETLPHLPCSKYRDNQKLGRTTRNCTLVVRGTTIYFSLIRTLVIIALCTWLLNNVSMETFVFLCLINKSKSESHHFGATACITLKCYVIIYKHWTYCTRNREWLFTQQGKMLTWWIH